MGNLGSLWSHYFGSFLDIAEFCVIVQLFCV